MQLDQRTFERLGSLLQTYARDSEVYKAKITGAQEIAKALSTEIGSAILDDALDRMAEISARVVNEKSSANERAEYRALRRITLDWAKKIGVLVVDARRKK